MYTVSGPSIKGKHSMLPAAMALVEAYHKACSCGSVECMLAHALAGVQCLCMACHAFWAEDATVAWFHLHG